MLIAILERRFWLVYLVCWETKASARFGSPTSFCSLMGRAFADYTASMSIVPSSALEPAAHSEFAPLSQACHDIGGFVALP